MDIKYFTQQYNFKQVVGLSSESGIGMFLKSIFGIPFLGQDADVCWFKSIIVVKIGLSFHK